MYSPSTVLRKTVDLSIYDVITRLGGLGLTNREIAVVIGISEQEFTNVLSLDDDLFEALKEARESPVRAVEASLFKKCLGFRTREEVLNKDGEVVSVKVKEMVPDTNAIMFYLKNRDKARWSDSSRLDVNISLADRMLAAHDKVKELNGGKKA